MITKELFVEIMNDVKSVNNFQKGLNNYLQHNGADGYIFTPDCSVSILKLLREIFNDRNEYINHFCFTLDFGNKSKVKSLTKSVSGDAKIPTTPEELFDLLVDNLNSNRSKDVMLP